MHTLKKIYRKGVNALPSLRRRSLSAPFYANLNIRFRLNIVILLALVHFGIFYALFSIASKPKTLSGARQMAYMMVTFPVQPSVVKPWSAPVNLPNRRNKPLESMVRATRLPSQAEAPVSELFVVEDNAVAPRPAKTAAEPLDLDALKAAARRLASDPDVSPLERRRVSQQIRSSGDNDMSRAIGKSGRPDCRKAYSGGTEANLFALIPLAVSTLTDKGCKW